MRRDNLFSLEPTIVERIVSIIIVVLQQNTDVIQNVSFNSILTLCLLM